MPAVDDVWAALKAKTAPSQHARVAREVLRSASGESTSTSRSRSKATDDDLLRRRASSAFAARGGAAPLERAGLEGRRSPPSLASRPSESPPPASSSAPPVPDLPDRDALERHVARDLNLVADAASPPRARLEALRRVAAVVDAAPAAVLEGQDLDARGRPLRPGWHRHGRLARAGHKLGALPAGRAVARAARAGGT